MIPVLLMVRELGQGGSERQCAETARALDRSLFEPHVAAMRDTGLRAEELRAVAVPVTCFPVRSFGNLSLLTGAARMGAYLACHRIQVVHTFDVPMNVFGVPAARFFRTPVVISSQRSYRTLISGRLRHLLRLTDLLVDAVVVNCQAMRRHLIEDERVPAAKIRLCYNGLNTEVFRPRPGPRPEILRDASLVIGAVCALRPEKDLATLVTAFARVRPFQPGLKLLIVGSGSVLPGLEQHSRALGVRQDCVFEPATADVARWLRAIDIFVLPSLSEALSNSLMEAMACGCAVVASQVGGNPEIVYPGKTGLLFPAGDAGSLAATLKELLENQEFRLSLAAAGSSFIERNFSLSQAAQRMEEIYREMVSRKTGLQIQPRA